MAWLTGDTIPETTTCRVIRIPDDPTFRRALSGALLELTKAENWEQFGTLTPEEQASAFLDALWTFETDKCETVNYPIHTQVSMLHATQVSGNGTLALATFAGWGGYYLRYATPANGQSIQTSFYLAKGSYNVYFWGWRANTQGKLDWYVDNTLKVSAQDWYSASNNYLPLSAGITIDTDGNHLLKAVVNGKHASSSNYYVSLAMVEFAPILDMGGV